MASTTHTITHFTKLLLMRRTSRSTKRYDYKVLSTVGTTEQDKYSLLHENETDSDESIESNESDGVVDVVLQEAKAHSEEEDTAVSALFANLTINSVAESEEGLLSDELLRINGHSSTDVHHSADGNSSECENPSGEHSFSSNTHRHTTAPPTMDATQLSVAEATISDDIEDFLDENEVSEVGEDQSEYDALIKRAEDFRSNYRSVHNQLLAVMGDTPYAEKYQVNYINKLEAIKEYLKLLKVQKKKLQSCSAVSNQPTKY